MSKQPEYIIVQAGGKGTRMQHLTRNKPKALVPINNLPMLFHLFRKYPNSKYIIIGDYHYEVLERYLHAFAEVEYQMVCASGYSGTCAGLRESLSHLPSSTPFLLIWSDLILPEEFVLPDRPGNYVGVAKDFPCRWKYENGCFKEERSEQFGVAGLFYFCGREELEQVPEEGEFVRWLSETGKRFDSMPLYKVKEYGLLAEYEKLGAARCRPFNRISVQDGLFIKEAIDAQGEELAVRETAWYQKVAGQHFSNIPRIVDYQPLKMEYIDGAPIYECEDLSVEQKRDILRQIVGCLKQVQNLEQTPTDVDSVMEAYIGKTYKRLEKVRELVPFAQDDYITINGRRCRNVFNCREALEKMVRQYIPKTFKLIHGDCTFSNIMLRKDGTPVLIDPRGYFGFTEIFGDPAYDWAKLYYSIVGNYDRFNRKRFSLEIGTEEVQLSIASNGWELLEPDFLQMLSGEVTQHQLKLLHALIWLSLTTYAWEDYDSICGAYYNGLYYLEELFS